MDRLGADCADNVVKLWQLTRLVGVAEPVEAQVLNLGNQHSQAIECPFPIRQQDQHAISQTWVYCALS